MGNLNRLQENLYQLLTEIDDICKKHDIKYFLAGGTALGTVRNHCFLPWDDDIDLYITRDNWNKLKSVIESEKDVLPKGRSLIYTDNTEYYNNPIPRYVDTTTTAIYQSQILPAKACGQHIELLIMDPMPNDEAERKEYIKLLKVYTELLSPYFVVCKGQTIEEWEEHYKVYKHYLRKMRFVGEQKVLKELERKLLYYPTEDCDTFCMRWGINILMYKKEYFGNGRPEVFERDKFPVGEKAECIFRVAYGDSWMYVPDYEEQVVHNSIQDLDTPFSEYTKRYLPKLRRNTIINKYKKNKRSNAKVYAYRCKVDRSAAELKARVNGTLISQELNQKEDYLRDLLIHKKYRELSEAFADYRALQFAADIKKFKVFVPISDKNIYTLVMSSIEQGKYYEANKYLNIRKTKNEPFSEELTAAENLMNICRELSIARYDLSDISKVQELIDRYESQYPQLLDILRAKVWILEKTAKGENDFSKIKSLCEDTLKIYPFDGETMAYLARAMAVLGEKDKATHLYEKAINNTRNGLIWQKVFEESGISRIDIERKIIEELNNEQN